MDLPINKANTFNTNLPETGTALIAAAIKPSRESGILRIYICLSITGVVSIQRISGGVTVTEALNGGTALTAGAGYIFSIPWTAGETINLICSTPTFAGSTCADGTGTCTGSPITLGVGVTTVVVTGAGTFTITLPAGVSGVAASGTATLAGSPVTLPAGAATAVDTGATTGNFTITLTGGVIRKLQIDETWN